MIIAVLVVIGVCLGSFVNALVWRVREQSLLSEDVPKKKHFKTSKVPHDGNGLSILNGRSMCPECRHVLAARDLIPVFSWLMLKGRCRYCSKPISIQYPLIELVTALLFVVSYLSWPTSFTHPEVAIFILWLGLLVGLIALIVYDARWLLLPNRIMYPLFVLAIATDVISIANSGDALRTLINIVLAFIVGGGIFYILFQVSGGKWIGGGDVKLGWLLGLIAGTPARSLLFIFIASIIGTLISLPLLAQKKIKAK